ncbi:hypothetical protein NPIL_678721 [Nephila pilipes]|uniref:Uncharacterized protein n=1 Tax=Nephila pilipes TaxID=299642 RepID=A0A8X6UFL6_NEPPI|nr:hypothetical protein NPIL_678721 [Nephila pilipes]
MSHNILVAYLLSKTPENLEDIPEIELISLWTTRQLELVNNSTSTPASTVKTFAVLLASAVSNSNVCCVVYGMESVGSHSCGLCKNPAHTISGNTVEEGNGLKIL